MRQLGSVVLLALVGMGFAIPVAAANPGELAAPGAASSTEDPPSPPPRSPEERVTVDGIDPSRITTARKGSADSTGDPAKDRRAVLTLTDA